ncbi:MAG: hypothetical protein ACLR0N_11045 [Bilophila wadsworthia]
MKRALALLIACGLLLGVTATSSFAADKVVIKMAGMKPDGNLKPSVCVNSVKS